jgi:hypothetical protein
VRLRLYFCYCHAHCLSFVCHSLSLLDRLRPIWQQDTLKGSYSDATHTGKLLLVDYFLLAVLFNSFGGIYTIGALAASVKSVRVGAVLVGANSVGEMMLSW